MKDTGAVYVPYVELDSSDKEAYDHVLDYQNHFAKLHGEPSIMRVITNNYDKNKVDNEFDEFFNEIGSGKVTRGGEGDKVDHSVSNELDKDIQKTTDSTGDNSTNFEPTKASRFSIFK